jgi:hypothetical protein
VQPPAVTRTLHSALFSDVHETIVVPVRVKSLNVVDDFPFLSPELAHYGQICEELISGQGESCRIPGQENVGDIIECAWSSSMVTLLVSVGMRARSSWRPVARLSHTLSLSSRSRASKSMRSSGSAPRVSASRIFRAFRIRWSPRWIHTAKD